MSNLILAAMKKNLTLVLICLFCIIGCEKRLDNVMVDNPIDQLISIVEEAMINPIKEYTYADFYSFDNPIEDIYMEYDQILIDAISKNRISKGGDLSNLFSNDFLERFPNINYDEVDKDIFKIITRINNSIVKMDDIETILKLTYIEKRIHKVSGLSEDTYNVLLSYCMTFRHLSLIHLRFLGKSVSSDDESWKECVLRKFAELNDCDDCYLEKLICALEWPICLGAKAIDCGIAELLD